MMSVVNVVLEVMRGATPHSGVEPCVGPKTIVMSFPRVVVEWLAGIMQEDLSP